MELEQLCQLGFPSITVSTDHYPLDDNHLHLLQSYHYYEEEEADAENNDSNCISFIKRNISPQDFSIYYTFPTEIPVAQYDDGQQRAGPSTADPSSVSEWRKYAAFQHYTNNLPESQQLRIHFRMPPSINLSIDQKVIIKMMIQPFVKLDEAHLNTRLRIEKLQVGVPSDQFLGLKPEEQYLGFYPDFVRLEIEPVFDGTAIPTFEKGGELPASLPSSSASIGREISRSTVSGRLGYGPAQINLERSWETQREVQAPHDLKVELIHVDGVDSANPAIFEWSIKRWNNYDVEYKRQKPHFELMRLLRPQLPFKSSAATLDPDSFPDILWKFPNDHTNLQFRISLQIHMSLVWFVGTRMFKSIGSAGEDVSFANEWDLKLAL